MSKMVRDGRADYRILEKARSLARQVGPRDWIGQAASIFRYIRDNIAYVQDPVGLETIAEPWKTMEIGMGDCDDMSVLAAALLHAIGHPARFVAVGFNGAQLSHVFTETRIGPRWIPLDPSGPLKFGQYPPGITSYMIESIAL